jgi:hypothetical protein
MITAQRVEETVTWSVAMDALGRSTSSASIRP